MMDDNNFPTNDEVVIRVPITFGSIPVTDTPIITKKIRKCGLCKEIGHDKRNCPKKPDNGMFFFINTIITDKTTQYFFPFQSNSNFLLQDVLLLLMIDGSMLQLIYLQLQQILLTMQYPAEKSTIS